MANTAKYPATSLPEPVTLVDIAKRCKLSKGSVSRALSMTLDKCPLSDATWHRVRKVSREMGYQVNAHARALASGKSMTIALIYEGTLPFLDSVYDEIVETFSATIRQHGYHLALVAMDDSGLWEESLLGGRADGCVCLHSVPARVQEHIQRARSPLVLLNGKSPLASGSVCVDDFRGSQLMTEHLLKLGHRRILLLTDTVRETPHHSITERQEGFLFTMRKSGLADVQPRCFEGDAAAFAKAWGQMTPKPTAVVCYSHLEAVHALRVLRCAGVEVPRDVSLTTFNDVFPVAVLDPALTCVAIQSVEIGRRGAQMLMDLVASEDAATRISRNNVVLDPVLIERESTAAAP